MEIDSTALDDAAAIAHDLVIPSVRLRHGPIGDPSSATTRFGGVPLAGPDFVWPRSHDGEALWLIGQLDTDQINGWLKADTLPADTVLAFFFDADESRQGIWGMERQSSQFWRVIAVPKSVAKPVTPPDDVTLFPARQLTGERVLTVPHPWEPVIEASLTDAYENLWPDADKPEHRVFGWPEPQQNPMQDAVQLVYGGIDWARVPDPDDPRIRELRADSGDWLLLWQIDSEDGKDEDELGWMWGDVGKLYYWIRRQDLAAGRFDRVWAIIQG